jgi:hypothetical protein
MNAVIHQKLTIVELKSVHLKTLTSSNHLKKSKMKKIITLIALFISVTVVAQQPAPAKVKVSKVSMNKFKAMYPQATNVDWSQDESGRYVAHYTENNKNRWITIDEKNDWTNSLFEIEKTDLPPAAIAQLDQWYDNATFVQYYKFIDEAGAIHYEADHEAGEMVSGPIFDKDGNAYNKAARPKGERPMRVQ